MDLGTTKMIARKEGGIGWMIFNQPEKHNAVSYDMWTAVPRIVAAFEGDAEVRVIVLTGAGERAFVSGADISEFDQKRSSEESIKLYDAAGEAAHAALTGASKPTLCMIRGICYGGGVGIALTTDIRICSMLRSRTRSAGGWPRSTLRSSAALRAPTISRAGGPLWKNASPCSADASYCGADTAASANYGWLCVDIFTPIC